MVSMGSGVSIEQLLAKAMPSPGAVDGALPADPEEEQSKLAAQVWAEFAEARKERLEWDYEWWVAWAWYNGRTNVFLDRSEGAGRIWRRTTKQPVHRRNLPLNLVGHSVDLLVAKQMRARPTFDAAPTRRGDMTKRLAARAARSTVRAIWDKNELTAERRTLLLDRVITGNAFIKVRYDVNMPPFRDKYQTCSLCQGAAEMPPPPELLMQAEQFTMQTGQVMPLEPMPCPQCAHTPTPGQQHMGVFPLGDVVAEPVSPWEVWPVKGAKRLEQGCFHGFKLTKDEAAARFKLKAEDIKPSAALEDVESDFARQARSHRMAADDKDAVWVVERWRPPLPGTQRPRLDVLVGDKLVWPLPGAKGEDMSLPPYQRVPLFHFRLRPSAESFWSNGIVLDMIAANDFVNRTRASFHRHRETMAFTKWFYEEGSIDSDRLVAEEGEAVPYRGSEAPVQRSPATMPEFYLRLFEMEQQFIPRLAGLQEIDQGKAPPNVEAYQALHFLAEQSETVHGPVYLEDERQWRQVAWASLRCAVAKYEPLEERLARICGTASVMEVNALKAADLSDVLDVRCEIGSALAHSPALRQENVYRALEVGLVTPQQVLARGLMDFGVIIGEDADDHETQEQVAQQENEAMGQGQPHQILWSAHDHPVHIEVHRRAAMEAQLQGNFALAQAADFACQQHIMAMAPQPQPGAPAGAGGAAPAAGAQPPFDAQQGAVQYEQPNAAGG